MAATPQINNFFQKLQIKNCYMADQSLVVILNELTLADSYEKKPGLTCKYKLNKFLKKGILNCNTRTVTNYNNLGYSIDILGNILEKAL